MNNRLIEKNSRRNAKVALSVLLLCPVLAITSAHAQWKVIDDQLIQDNKGQWKGENKQRDEANKSLKAMQTIGKHESAGKLSEPDEKLDAENPSATVNLGAEERCPTPTSTGVVQQQWQLCQEIVKTETAQYKYSLKMYENTKERHKRLEAIQNERSAIKADEQGKLQDNTNKLLALMSLMEIDRQQQKTYMDAYEARLRYLTTARDLLTQQALQGKSGANPIAGLIGAGVLKVALEAVQTDRRYGQR